jgi:serine/threonine-protein kinase
VNRLGVFCLVWAALWALALVFNNLIAPALDLATGQMIPWSGPANAIAGICILVSLSLFGYSHRSRRDLRSLLRLGLGYEVVLALAIGVVNQWVPYALAGRLSWICVLILIYPMIVPSSPRSTFFAALLAATMDPVGLVIAKLRGLELPGVSLLLWTYMPNYVCAVLAVLPSYIITRLGQQVSQAREMGSYRLVELIGRGGMGEVWRAEHRLLARPAAIKVIRPERLWGSDHPAEHRAIDRFRREAEVAARLRSPHTIQLYDFGSTHEGRLYVVMELLTGLDLDALVRQFGPLLPARVVHLLCQACHSLAEAHAHGLVHRDIKPSNLYLARLGLDCDILKVLDFGLVKRVRDGTPVENLVTAPDMIAGTPAYVAPEIASGREIDHRADIYSLGCVAYWMLCRHVVFDGRNPLQVLLQHVQCEPIPPSKYCDSIPPALERVVLACLHKRPDDRPSTVEELSIRLAECDVGEPWTQMRARAWWQSHLSEAMGDLHSSGRDQARHP